MKKLLCLIVVAAAFNWSYKIFADEVSSKTDGSFVGSHDSFVGENVQQQTDNEFVGAGTINAENTYFAGESYQQQVGNDTVPAFAQDNTQTAKDGIFIGEDVQKKTDGSFVGDNYGK